MPGGIERDNLHPELRSRLPGDFHNAAGSHAIRPAARTISGHRQICQADFIMLSGQVVLDMESGLFGPFTFSFMCDVNRSHYFLTPNEETLTGGIMSYSDLAADRYGTLLPTWEQSEYVHDWCSI
jgi:hypothetical protein